MEVRGPGCGKVQKDGAHKTTVDGGFRDGSTGARGVEKWKSARRGEDGTGRDGTRPAAATTRQSNARRAWRAVAGIEAPDDEAEAPDDEAEARDGVGARCCRIGREAVVGRCARAWMGIASADTPRAMTTTRVRTRRTVMARGRRRRRFPRRRSPCGTWSSATPSGARDASSRVWDVCESCACSSGGRGWR